MSVQRIYDSGLCTQCGTCVALCPEEAVELIWDALRGYRLRVRQAACSDCGRCLTVCPGAGFDHSDDAWWRDPPAQAPAPDFLGPWRGLWFGWASDPRVRHAGASGGVATALLQGALDLGLIDGALLVGSDPDNALETRPEVARTAAQVAACRGSKYNVAPVNILLRRVLDEPGRYALVGLPCHIQGLRLAQRRSRRLRERIVLALGIFCGLTAEPRATALAARRCGIEPRDLARVSYRGPGWPGVLRLETKSGDVREVPYPDYYDAYAGACTPPRCRLCPDALAEAADVSIGDAWLDRFTGSDGVSDVIARTAAGERIVDALSPRWLTLTDATAGDMVASQAEAYRVKRGVFRGRLWLRGLAGRPLPRYPGLATAPSPGDRLSGLRDAARERLYRALGRLRYP
jgi:coenzyme F420 hydrogenase subunit beta